MPLEPDRPQVGWYKIERPGAPRAHFVKDREFVPARIYMSWPTDPETGLGIDRPPYLNAEINGEPCDPYTVWEWLAKRPITETEYGDMMRAEGL